MNKHHTKPSKGITADRHCLKCGRTFTFAEQQDRTAFDSECSIGLDGKPINKPGD